MELEDRLTIARCPVCGKDLAHVERTRTCGHVRFVDAAGVARCVLFTACAEHYDAAKDELRRDPRHKQHGYLGEWEERFGVMPALRCVGPIKE